MQLILTAVIAATLAFPLGAYAQAGTSTTSAEPFKAQDHVFGYTVLLDISDRGGRPPGGFSAGVDWFLMKGQDTFGPMGPFIVPKEFYGNPMTDLKQTLLVGTDQRQQADSSDMIRSVWEVIEYASSLVTLQPGDVIGADGERRTGCIKNFVC